MLVAVHADRPASRLPLANAVPEVPSRIIDLQERIPVVRYDREDGPDPADDERVFDLIPDAPVHRRTEVVEPQQVFGGHRHLHHGLQTASRSRNARFHSSKFMRAQSCASQTFRPVACSFHIRSTTTGSKYPRLRVRSSNRTS